MKILVLSLLVLISPSALALDVERLFMPGKVIEGHKEYETECKKCHSRLEKITQDELCLDCHEKVSADVDNNEGFHGRAKSVRGVECKICHADHRGREANLINLDVDRFDHRETDFELLGKHVQAECKACHKDGKKYREAPARCFDCHEQDDAHETKLGEKCDQCHNPKGWGSEQFDHDETDFKLLHSHQKVACDLCHLSQDYKDAPSECVSCHAIKDVHQQRFGKKCQDCHSEKEWSETHFDHDKDTKYRLKGTHSRVDCHSCHALDYQKKRSRQTNKKQRSCYSCHRLDDPHKGENGKQCEQCHNEKKWSDSRFDHDRKTDFPLRGAHKTASCQSCHFGDKKDQKPEMDCYSCHKHQDAHDGQLSETCDDCHNERSWWMEDVRFDHDLTAFPLIGLHAVSACEACHLTSRFQDPETDCNSCHEADDIHEQALGQDCERCHSPNDWLIWHFDHDRTDFELRGIHRETHCHGCHHGPLDEMTRQETAHRCIDCHNRDDIHDGNFGPDCEQCHSQQDFKTFKLDAMQGGHSEYGRR